RKWKPFVLAVWYIVHCVWSFQFLISIDCGIPSGSSYTDDTTGINYVSDSSFVETGVSKSVSFTAQRQLQNLMSGSRNCYTLIHSKTGKRQEVLDKSQFHVRQRNSVYLDFRASVFSGTIILHTTLQTVLCSSPDAGTLVLSMIHNISDIVKMYMTESDIERSIHLFQLFQAIVIVTSLMMSTALTPTNATNPITMILENSDPTVREPPQSTLPPLINALEIYVGNTYPQSLTSQDDDDAVRSIKTSYNVKRNWQGDPCLPNSYIWEGLNCSDASLAPPRITLLDLSNNDLTGDIPESLSGLKFLRVLNLEKNKLTGSFPSDLLKRSKSGSLLLRVGDNPGLCTEVSCGKSNKKTLITAAGASLAALFILLLLSGVFWKIKKRSNKPVEEDTDSETRNRPKVDSNTLLFTFQDIVKMTNNFGRVLGKGGFGTVYHGYYNDLQVAVKLLSESSAQGFKEFRSEVEVLVRVHHVNLTALIGYFHESNQMGLVYEFMANGNMADHLSGKYDHSLSWTQRLQIALDAAQGLEYLHSGCKPAIVHRDVKTSNILLNEKNRAKLADFGLSRSFQTESRSHVCFKTNELNEKSDIFSFGVVLLEMVTGKIVIFDSETKRVHVSDWVVSILKSTNDVSNVVDSKMGEDFDANSVWKIVELALASVSQNVAERPNMQQIVRGLTECLQREESNKNH
ncbi:hypothetical protein F2Q70_00038029, partial [Brassica cretica]